MTNEQMFSGHFYDVDLFPRKEMQSAKLRLQFCA